MKNHRALTFSFFSVAVALLMAAPAAAQTECQPDDLFCAELRIGPGRAGVRVGPGQAEPAPPPPPQPQPEPPTVVVQPEPDPPPPTVVVQPAPQPQPQPQVVHVQPAPQPQPQPQPRERRRRFPYSAIGVHLHLSGLFGDELAMGGAGSAFRIRPNPHFALDLGAALFHGNDYNGLARTELPVNVDAIFFFNPQHRFQFYALIGANGSWSHAEGRERFYGTNVNRDYGHLGGHAGLGVEWRISRVFALNLDVRGFLRQRVDDDPRPEFTEPTRGGSQSTDTSGGVVGQVGMTFYFGR
ncbi:MAG TPA: hypothetical protein RMH99_27385 [Sandaracinaceae bacterium LLY-WYZ-13_1]|nr:hypothetical protein [Sandaracinaceae bacterium LLY-WYZ-13_1]